MTPIRPYANDNGKAIAFVTIVLLGGIVWGLAVIGAFSLAKSCPDDRVLLTKYQDRVVEVWP